MSVKVIFGGAGFQSAYGFKDPESIREAFDALQKHGVNTLDTARLYGESEKLIGLTPGHEDFVIDTKLMGGFGGGSLTKEAVIADSKDSLEKVKIKQFDIMYIHAPDTSVPFEETLEGINEVYKLGIFKRFGLSNFNAEQVQKVYDIAKSKGWVLPTVYQGNYSPVARKLEALLFPTLRKLGIAFYAYSPLAGGFLTKTKQQVEEGVGRFGKEALGGLYHKLYVRPTYLEALAKWNDIAEKEGISKAELAYRWVAYHSVLKPEYGDGVIFGASRLKQIEETASGIKKGPLSDAAVEGIQQIWESVEPEAPVDNFQMLKPGEGH